jgi:hypothetical protein
MPEICFNEPKNCGRILPGPGDKNITVRHSRFSLDLYDIVCVFCLRIYRRGHFRNLVILTLLLIGVRSIGADTGGPMYGADAKAHCAGLSLDGSGWHLPTISELRTLIRGCPGTVTGGACGVTDECLDLSCIDEGGCTDCSSGNGPADGCYWPDEIQGTCSWYRSSSPVEDADGNAWHVSFDYGYVVSNVVYGAAGHVRCVR